MTSSSGSTPGPAGPGSSSPEPAADETSSHVAPALAGTRPRSRRAVLLAAAAIALMSLNLRPAANSLGAVIPAIRDDLGLTATVAGMLNATPGFCFVVFGLAAPAVGARIGVQRTIVVALIAMVAGQLLRISVPAIGFVFAGSVLALAGMAMGNVLLPGLVRTLFPGTWRPSPACTRSACSAAPRPPPA